MHKGMVWKHEVVSEDRVRLAAAFDELGPMLHMPPFVLDLIDDGSPSAASIAVAALVP